jgi:hypothetical protein
MIILEFIFWSVIVSLLVLAGIKINELIGPVYASICIGITFALGWTFEGWLLKRKKK